MATASPEKLSCLLPAALQFSSYERGTGKSESYRNKYWSCLERPVREAARGVDRRPASHMGPSGVPLRDAFWLSIRK